MGDRISIAFTREGNTSVALFSHWGGKQLLSKAVNYIRGIMKREAKLYPLDRGEPSTVMVDFIRHLTRHMNEVTNDLYLGKDSGDGDNSDNGHFNIDTSTGNII